MHRHIYSGSPELIMNHVFRFIAAIGLRRTGALLGYVMKRLKGSIIDICDVE